MGEERRVREVLARYVRATDARDGATQGALFTDEAVVRIFSKTIDGAYAQVGEPLIGGAAVEFAVANFMAPHPPLGSSHHVTADHIIEVDGAWKITRHHVLQDLPLALPDAGPVPSGRV